MGAWFTVRDNSVPDSARTDAAEPGPVASDLRCYDSGNTALHIGGRCDVAPAVLGA